ncbi:MAG: trypsin-like serine protease, partial [Anaerolineae bacterium]|nr:trypsin-like serine protease [Anaerolineae bacterium]NIN98206.1 trypsin-like serine protease [Anaerolineae bacterium]
MRTKLFSIAIVAVLLLFIVPMAYAITYGEPDGEGHPNVGVLVIELDGEKFGICSGTLIDTDVFLTAGHCTSFLPSLGISDVWVSFDAEFDSETSTLHQGAYVTHPDFGHDFARSNDLAVVLLDEELTNIAPASLPTAGLFDQMGPRGLRGQQFTAVGYGVTEPSIGGGPPTFSEFGVRRVARSSFMALNKNWLHLSQNNAIGNSGTCFGDSGGPNFLGSGSGETDIIAAITSTGDAMCLATNVIYRLDTPSARD